MGPDLAVGAVVLLAPIDGPRGGQRDEPRVVLIQRGRPPMQGTWTLPGGRVERGEGLHDALRREVREETGLEVEVGALIEVIELRDPGGAHHFVILDYVARPLDARVAEASLRAGDDAADARWVALDDLAQYGVTDAVQRVIGRAVQLSR